MCVDIWPSFPIVVLPQTDAIKLEARNCIECLCSIPISFYWTSVLCPKHVPA